MLDFRRDVPIPSREPKLPAEAKSVFARLTSHIPPAQFSKYTLVGIWNTLFGYGSYAALTAVFTRRMPHGYILAAVVSGLVNISLAFLGYKWFVFKTKGNYLREWLRCHVVYGTTALIGILVLPAFVYGYQRFVGLSGSAPYIAGATVTGLNVIISFFGHRNFSFAGAKEPSQE
jgi:putative flippase GtrA